MTFPSLYVPTAVPSAPQETTSCTFAGVYKQRQFTYTGKKDHLLWEEYGVELHFPSSSAVHIEGTVSVLSTDDNYIFPKGSELVSAVYDVSTKGPFPKPVTVRLQHCVPIDSENEASTMTFVIADTAQGPPYKFYPLNGGSFTHRSSYAEIQLTHFSMPAIIRWCRRFFDRPVPFFASVYYLQKSRASFVVTKNLKAHINVSYSTLNLFYSILQVLAFHAGC